jgi:hypothetical protein
VSISSITREIAFVLIVVSIAWAKAPRPPACAANEAEYSVITALLQQTERKLTVMQQISDDPHFTAAANLSVVAREGELIQYREQMKKSPDGGVVFLGRPQEGSSLPPELISDYESKNTQVCLWDVSHIKSNKVLTWDSENSFLRDDPDSWWRGFHTHFGSQASAARFSRVGLDSSGKKAVVHVSSRIAKNGAGGTLYYLEKNHNRWVIKFAHHTWTT